jgi:hypothetical protein
MVVVIGSAPWFMCLVQLLGSCAWFSSLVHVLGSAPWFRREARPLSIGPSWHKTARAGIGGGSRGPLINQRMVFSAWINGADHLS